MSETILIEEIQSLTKELEEKHNQYLAIKKQQLIGRYIVLKNGKCLHIKGIKINYSKFSGGVPEVVLEAIFIDSLATHTTPNS